MKTLTTSRMKCFRRCQRLHKYKYIDGYSSAVENDNLSIGTAVHKGLERYFNGTTIGSDHLPSDPYQSALVECMLYGYIARWEHGTMGSEFDTVAVEKQFSAQLVNPETECDSKTWILGGKIDVIVKDRNTGRLHMMEHKTTSEDISPGSEYWKRLRMDGQVSTYYQGCKSLGYEIDSCIYDVLKKPALRPLKSTPPESRKFTKDGKLYANQRAEDETPAEFRVRVMDEICSNPDKYYSRGTVVRLESEMKEFQYDAWQTAKQMHESELAERFPRNPDACNMFGHTCEFFPVCTGETTLLSPMYKKLDSVNPELVTP